MIKIRNNGELWNGLSSERILNFPSPIKEGMLFRETDTGDTYIVFGHDWVIVSINDLTGFARLDLTNQPFQSALNSTTAFQINQSDSTNVFNVDTVNRRLIVGDDATTYANPAVIIERDLDGSEGGSSHGFVDNAQLDSGYSYASFDAQTRVVGVKSYVGKHVASFQANGLYDSDGDIDNWYGYTTTFTNNGGNIDSWYGSKINNPSGTGAFTNKYGLYINGISGGTSRNFNLYSTGTNTLNYMAGTTTPGQNIAQGTSDFSGNIVHVKNTLGRSHVVVEGHFGAFIDLIDYHGTSNSRILQSEYYGAVLIYRSLNDDLTTKVDNIFSITSAGSVGVGNSVPQAKLHIKGTTDEIQQIIQGAVGQSNNLQEWQNNSDVVLSGISSIGIPFSNIGLDSESFFAGNDVGNTTSTGYENVAVGNNILQNNTTGYRNVFIGSYTGQYNTTGYNNMGVGRGAGTANTTGHNNIFFGNDAGQFNTIGIRNLYLGSGAGYSGIDSNFNVAIGFLSLQNNLHGNYNVTIGNEAGRYETGSYKLYVAVDSTTTPLIYGEFDNELLKINGTFQTAQDRVKSTETSTTTATMSDDVEVHFCNSATTYTLTLPTHITGKEIKIINTNSGIVTLTPVSGLIGGSATYDLPQNEVRQLTSNGTNWY